MAKNVFGPPCRPAERNGLPYWIDAIIEFGANEQATPMLTAGFGLMAASHGALKPEDFLRYPGVSAWRDGVLDSLAGFEGEADAILVDLMVDALCELRPVKAGLTSGYFFAQLSLDDPAFGRVFKEAIQSNLAITLEGHEAKE